MSIHFGSGLYWYTSLTWLPLRQFRFFSDPVG